MAKKKTDEQKSLVQQLLDEIIIPCPNPFHSSVRGECCVCKRYGDQPGFMLSEDGQKLAKKLYYYASDQDTNGRKAVQRLRMRLAGAEMGQVHSLLRIIYERRPRWFKHVWSANWARFSRLEDY